MEPMHEKFSSKPIAIRPNTLRSIECMKFPICTRPAWKLRPEPAYSESISVPNSGTYIGWVDVVTQLVFQVNAPKDLDFHSGEKNLPRALVNFIKHGKKRNKKHRTE